MKKKTRKKISKCTDETRMRFENYPDIITTGFHQYHTLPSWFTRSVDEIGGCVGVEIEMSFQENTNGRSVFTNTLGSNLLWASSDSSITGHEPLEICTVPLLRHDAISPAFWKPITNRLVGLGARSYNNCSTGLHVHLDKRMFVKEGETPKNFDIMVARIIYGLYVQDAPWKRRVFQRNGSESYAQRNIQGEVLKICQTKLPEAMRCKECVQKLIEEVEVSHPQRYGELNTGPDKTVEFRCGKGTLAPERIASIAEFCCLFADYCKTFGKRLYQTSQKHFDAYISRHARTNSLLQNIFNPSTES